MPTSQQPPIEGATTLCLLIPTLVQMVHARFWWFHEEEIEDAVLAAIEHLLEQDKDFLGDEEKEIEDRSLRNLYDSACHFASNKKRADRRRAQREEKYARGKKWTTLRKIQ